MTKALIIVGDRVVGEVGTNESKEISTLGFFHHYVEEKGAVLNWPDEVGPGKTGLIVRDSKEVVIAHLPIERKSSD